MDTSAQQTTKSDVLEELQGLVKVLQEAPEGQANLGIRLNSANKALSRLNQPTIAVGKNRKEQIQLVEAAIESLDKS